MPRPVMLKHRGVAMEPQSRGTVLLFRNPARGSATAPGRPLPHGSSGTCAAVRPEVPTDEAINQEWDLLIRLATQAWSWRDPESVDVLERTVTRLRAWIGYDWSQ